MSMEALAELERLAAWSQIRDGALPEWATRPLLPWEIRAGVNFVALDRLLVNGYNRVTGHLTDLAGAVVSDLRRVIAGVTDPWELDRVVTGWAAHLPPPVRARMADAEDALSGVLRDVVEGARTQMLGEAAFQGVVAARAVPAVPAGRFRSLVTSPVSAVAARIALAVLGRSQRPSDPVAPVAAARAAGIDMGTDLGRQAVNIAQGTGRHDALTVLPEPERIYASELLDRHTCLPCKQIDGTEYESLALAELDYPDSGTYRRCRGDARCRGTLVAVWGEAPATR